MKDLDRKQINAIGMIKRRNIIITDTSKDDIVYTESNPSKLQTPESKQAFHSRIPSVKSKRTNLDM